MPSGRAARPLAGTSRRPGDGGADAYTAYARMMVRPPAFRRPRPDRLTLLIAAIALLGAGLALARVYLWGPALQWDSVNYIEVARSLLAGDGFTQPAWYLFRADAYAVWPPLYPLLLAGGGLGAADPYHVAGPLGAVAFGLTILVAGRWMASRLESRRLVLWACLAVALSVPLSRVATAALSEMPFILFATLALVRADAFLKTGRRPALLWAVAFTALACLTRYIGVALIPAVAVMLLLRDGPLGERAKAVVTYAFPSALPLALWALRNGLLTGTPGGSRNTEVTTTVPETLGRALEILSGWLLLDAPPERFQIAASALIGALLALLALRALRLFRAGGTGRGKTAPLLVLCITTYLAALAASSAITTVSGGPRFYAPLYVPLVALTALSCEPAIRHLRERAMRPRIAVAASAIVALALIAWLALHVPLQARELGGENPIDVDAREPLWSIPFLQSIDEDQLGGTVLSNGPRVLEDWFGPGRDYRLLAYNHADAVDRIRAAEPGASVVWIHDLAVSVRYGYDARDLRGLPMLETVAEHPDGVVFRANGGGPNGWRRLAERVAGEAPVASAFYSLYLIDGSLVYVRERCAREDMRHHAFLHVLPSDASGLPGEREARGFANLDFSLSRTGAYFGGTCIARAGLPRYGIDRIHTGQFNNTGELWRVEFPVDGR